LAVSALRNQTFPPKLCLAAKLLWPGLNVRLSVGHSGSDVAPLSKHSMLNLQNLSNESIVENTNVSIKTLFPHKTCTFEQKDLTKKKLSLKIS